MVTWSLENAIETADSMRARGYGLPGRTSFSIYRFDSRDSSALAWLVSAARICSPDGLPAEQRSGTIPRSKPPRGHR